MNSKSPTIVSKPDVGTAIVENFLCFSFQSCFLFPRYTSEENGTTSDDIRNTSTEDDLYFPTQEKKKFTISNEANYLRPVYKIINQYLFNQQKA